MGTLTIRTDTGTDIIRAGTGGVGTRLGVGAGAGGAGNGMATIRIGVEAGTIKIKAGIRREQLPAAIGVEHIIIKADLKADLKAEVEAEVEAEGEAEGEAEVIGIVRRRPSRWRLAPVILASTSPDTCPCKRSVPRDCTLTKNPAISGVADS